MSGYWTEIVIIVVLIVANGFFAASEIAVVSSRKGRLEQRVREGRRGAATALKLAENPNRFLSTVQVGITLVSTFAAAFGGASLARLVEQQLAASPALAPYASTIGLAVVSLAIAYLSLIVGELVPKRLALQNAEAVAGLVAPFMRQISRLAAPVVWFLTISTEAVLRLLGRHNVAEEKITQDDIMALVREGAAGGTVEASEQAIITSVFSFTDRTVRSMMTPRTQITAVEAHTPLAEVLALVIESGYSRIPVYDDTLDHVTGLLFAKDLLRAREHSHGEDWSALLRPAVYVLESQRAVTALEQLKQGQSAMALVLDEYGQVAGLVTLEDMLEELVGEIADEYDEAEDAKLVLREDGSYLVDGLMPIDEFLDKVPIPKAEPLVRSNGVETVAGLVLALMGHIPSAGAILEWHEHRFEVMDMDGRRIDKVMISARQ